MKRPTLYKPIIHRHHVIPRHAGGERAAWNTAKLTLFEHAEAHLIRWLLFKDEKDRIAWLALSGMIPVAEASRRARVAHGKTHKGMKMGPCSEQRKENISKALRERYKHTPSIVRGRKYGPRSEQVRLNLSKAKSNKSAILLTPEGKGLLIRNTNLHKLCKQYKFNYSNMMYRGHSIGYRCVIF